MNNEDIEIQQVPWATHADTLTTLRRQVFIEEQGVPEAEELDDKDVDSEHFLALTAGGTAIGCARLTAEGQIGRIAVLKEARGWRIGRQLLDAAILRGREQGLEAIYLHAQSHAIDFYRKAGFSPRGPRFQDAGIDHQAMLLRLLPEPLTFSTEQAAASALDQCLKAPQRHLELLHPDLDPALFDRPACLDGLSQFVRQGDRCRLRVLVYSSQRIVSRGHGLVELARRLDGRVEIRKVPKEYATEERAFLCWDAQGYWLLPNTRSPQGFVNYDHAALARHLTERFDYLWEHARPDPELRLLRL